MFHKEMYGEVDVCNEIELTIFTFSDFVCYACNGGGFCDQAGNTPNIFWH